MVKPHSIAVIDNWMLAAKASESGFPEGQNTLAIP